MLWWLNSLVPFKTTTADLFARCWKAQMQVYKILVRTVWCACLRRGVMKTEGCVQMIESVLQTSASFRVLKDTSSAPQVFGVQHELESRYISGIIADSEMLTPSHTMVSGTSWTIPYPTAEIRNQITLISQVVEHLKNNTKIVHQTAAGIH